MEFAVLPPYRAGVAADPDWMTRFAQRVEHLGFESMYVVEHVVVATDYESAYPYSTSGRMPLRADCPIPDPLELAAFLLARTTNLIIGTGILVAPHHHPLILAKRAATLDVLSGGRFRLGVGVGWMAEELESTGIDFTTRGRRLDEQLEVMTQVWAGDDVSHSGEFYEFDHVWSHPKPTGGRVPIHVGGHSRAAARRAARFGDGFHPLGIDDDVLEDRLAIIREGAGGRALELTLGAPLQTVDPEVVEHRRAQGATRLVLSTATADFSQLDEELGSAVARLGSEFTPSTI